MSLSLKCSLGEPNKLMDTSPANSYVRKKRQRDSKRLKKYTTRYVLRGQTVCCNIFAAITQITPRVIQLHVLDVSTNFTISRYETEHSESAKRKNGANKIAAMAFLKSTSNLNGLPCLPGLGLTENYHVALLPSNIANIDLYAV